MYAGGLRASFIKGNKFIHSNNSISEEEEIEERSTLIHEKRKKKKKVQAYGETYDASIIEREFPWKKCSSFRTRALILPPGQIFCQTTGEKSGTVVVGKRKKEEKRISSNNHAMTNKVWKERLPFVRGSLSPPLFSFSRKTLLTILHD